MALTNVRLENPFNNLRSTNFYTIVISPYFSLFSLQIMKMRFFLPLAILAFSSILKAQDKLLDSLHAALKISKHDTSRAIIYNQLFDGSDEKDMLPFAEKALAIVNANPDPKNEKEKLSFQSSKAKALGNIGYFHLVSGNNKEALDYFNRSLEIFILLKDKKSLSSTYSNMAFVYENLSNYPEALDHFQKSQELRKELHDSVSYANGLRHMAMIYSSMGNYKESLNLNFESLKIYEKLNDIQGIASSYNDIGHSFAIQQNSAKAIEYAEKAFKIHKKGDDKSFIARSMVNLGFLYGTHTDFEKGILLTNEGLSLFEKIGDKKGVASGLNVLGGLYETKKKYPEAYEVLKKSLVLFEEIHNKRGIANACNGIGIALLNMNQPDEALKYAKRSLEVAQQIKQPKEIFKSAQLLNKIYKHQGDYKNSLAMYELYIDMRDSIVNDNNKKATLQKQFAHEYDKKEVIRQAEQDKKDAINAEEKHRQKILIISVIVVLILISGIAIVIYRSLRQNKKAHKIIKHQKEEVEHQKEIVEEKQKEIVDSINYAQRIQKALLAGNEILNENLPDHFVLFKPKDIVSGDFYWASVLSDGCFALVTADSTGHGVPGAIMSMLNISCLNEAVEGKLLTRPNEILNYTRSRIIKHLMNDGSETGGKDGMDCSLVSFNFKNNQLTYSSANNPVWVVRNKPAIDPDSYPSAAKGLPTAQRDIEMASINLPSGQAGSATHNELIELDPDKMPVGKHDKDSVSFSERVFNLQKGDVVYTLTDGFPDQFGGDKGKKFMYKKLKELIRSIAPKPLAEQKEILIKTLNDWKGPLEQVDDVLVIGVRI